MISAKTFSPELKSMNSSFIKNVYIFDIFYHFPQFEQSKSEVWKGKNLCARGVNVSIEMKSVIINEFVILYVLGTVYVLVSQSLYFCDSTRV